jgi:hypothetical protein
LAKTKAETYKVISTENEVLEEKDFDPSVTTDHHGNILSRQPIESLKGTLVYPNVSVMKTELIPASQPTL